MRTSVLGCLTVLLAAVCTAVTSPTDISNQADTAGQAERATGNDALQEGWCPPCVQEALSALEWNAARSLKDAAHEVEVKLQVHDDAIHALLEKHMQVEVKLLEQMEKTLEGLLEQQKQILDRLPSSELKASTPTSSLSTPAFLPSSTPPSLVSSAPASPPSSTAAFLPSSTSPSLLSSASATLPSSTPTPTRLGAELYVAANEGNLERVRNLLDLGAEVNYRGSGRRSPLMAALLHNGNMGPCKESVVSLLLQRGALVGAADKDGWTPLHFAAQFDESGRCVALLIGAGADVVANATVGATPLHRAAWNGNEAAVRALLGAGADVDAVTRNGETALHWAALLDREEIVRLLLAAGARKDLTTWAGAWEYEMPFDLTKSDNIRILLRP